MERERLSGFKRFIFSESVVFAIRLFVAAVFIYSGSVKFIDLNGFAESIGNYSILPQYLLFPAACLISTIEVLLGLFFLLGVFLEESGTLLIFLILIFILAMISALIRGIDTSCGCFSKTGESLGIKDILRDIFLILLILWSEIGRKHERADD